MVAIPKDVELQEHDPHKLTMRQQLTKVDYLGMVFLVSLRGPLVDK